MTKRKSNILTLLCTSLVWCSMPKAMEDSSLVLDSKIGEDGQRKILVLTQQGHAKALALQSFYDKQQKKEEDIPKESLKSSTNDEDVELARTLGLSPQELELSKALHLSFEKQSKEQSTHVSPSLEAKSQPKSPDIPYPILQEKKDNGPELKPRLLNHGPEINVAKEREKITDLTELVSQISTAQEEAWKVYLSLISPDPETEALKDDEEKTRRRQAREEEKGKASKNWGMLFTLHTATKAELKELETKASIEQDDDPELKLALLASRQAHKEEQNKIANEIREANERKKAEERQQAQERRNEARRELEEVRAIQTAKRQSLFSRINELEAQKTTWTPALLNPTNDFIPSAENESYKNWLEKKLEEVSGMLKPLQDEILAFSTLDTQIHEEIMHLIQGGDPRDLPWKQELSLTQQNETSSLSSSSLTPIPSNDTGKGSGSEHTFF